MPESIFSSRGPFSVPRSPQGHPVLIQAGQSGRGQSFAARWAELVFVIHHNLEAGKQQYAAFKAAVAAAGPRSRLWSRSRRLVTSCVAELEAAAQEKRADHRGDGETGRCAGADLRSDQL